MLSTTFSTSTNLHFHFTDVVREMFDNWDVVRTFLINNINVTNDLLLTLSQAKVDMLSVFMKERGVISLKDTICSAEKLSDMLYFNNSHVTADELSSALCQLNDSQTQTIAITLLKNVNFDFVFKNVSMTRAQNRLSSQCILDTSRANCYLSSISVNEC